jgi:hypothetical protein
MAKCPAPKRVISEVVDGSRRQEFLNNASVIILTAEDAPHYGYLRLWRKEISQTAWRLGPDPLWDEIWTKFRGRWRIIMGTIPYEGDNDDRLARGAPVCGWIAVQFDSDDEWLRYKLAAKKTRLKSPELSEAENEPAPTFDPDRIIPCPASERAVSPTTDERLESLPAGIVVYAFDGLSEPLAHGRLTCGKIDFESGKYGGGRVTSDGLFDYLHTKYRGRWKLYVNTHSFLCSPKLAVSFGSENDLVDFRNSWRGGDPAAPPFA